MTNREYVKLAGAFGTHSAPLPGRRKLIAPTARHLSSAALNEGEYPRRQLASVGQKRLLLDADCLEVSQLRDVGG